MSRPGTAPASRSRVEQAEEPSRIEPVKRQEAALETKDMVTPIGGAEIEEASSVHEEEQGGLARSLSSCLFVLILCYL